jgi:hypothetical protein
VDPPIGMTSGDAENEEIESPVVLSITMFAVDERIELPWVAFTEIVAFRVVFPAVKWTEPPEVMLSVPAVRGSSDQAKTTPGGALEPAVLLATAVKVWFDRYASVAVVGDIVTEESVAGVPG